MRPSGRTPEEARPVRFTRRYTRHAEGSVLVEFGETKVICTASVDERVPRFIKGSKNGWINAEYGMLPRATHHRTAREAATGRQSGRTREIQRLIARSLRSVVDLESLGERSLTVDCDVIQADGGTRTAAITGGYVALMDACDTMLKKRMIPRHPIHGAVAAISVGIYQGEAILDLDYHEDSNAETDMNVVMNDAGAYVELQGTAEGHAFREQELQAMLSLARQGITRLIEAQRQVLETAP